MISRSTVAILTLKENERVLVELLLCGMNACDDIYWVGGEVTKVTMEMQKQVPTVVHKQKGTGNKTE